VSAAARVWHHTKRSTRNAPCVHSKTSFCFNFAELSVSHNLVGKSGVARNYYEAASRLRARNVFSGNADTAVADAPLGTLKLVALPMASLVDVIFRASVTRIRTTS
jgi:hypothetical protein